MKLIVTCKCGQKFRVTLEGAELDVACPGCGKRSKVRAPKQKPAPVAPPPAEDEIKLQPLERPAPAMADDEVKLQDLPPNRFGEDEVFEKPDEEEEDSGGYGLDAEDGRVGLDVGSGMYGTVGVINVDEQAHSIAYGCKGDWALASQGETVLILNMKTKKKIAHFEEHEAEVTSVALSITEPLALSGDDDGELRFWELASLKRRKKIQAHEGAVNAVALSNDRKHAASGGDDGCIHLWELETGKKRELEYADWTEWEEEVTFVTFSRDGSKLLAGGSGGRVSLWDVASRKRIKRYPGLELPISCLRLSDEGGRITATTHPISHRGDSYLIICHWDTKTGKPINQINLAVDSSPCCIAPDRGGVRIILGGGGPWLGVWELERGYCKHLYDELRGNPVSLAVSPLNNRVLAALDNSKLQLFSLEPF